MTRVVLTAVIAATLVLSVLAVLTGPDAGHQLGHGLDPASTSDTSTTQWAETQPSLGERFDAYRAGVARHDAKTRRKPATKVMRGQWPWDAVKDCETPGLGWDANTGNGFEGGLQFHPQTWSAYLLPGYPPRAFLATREQQIAVAERVLNRQGWNAWPTCSRKLGLR